MARARSAARRVRCSRAARARALVLLAAAVAVVVAAVAMAAAEEERQQPVGGGTFEFNLPGHGNVKASWRVVDEEESRWLDRVAAESFSGSAARGEDDGRHRIPFGDDSVKFSSDAYEFIGDLLSQGGGDGEHEQPSRGKGDKPTGYWKKVGEERSRMLDRIVAANARQRAESNGDDHRAAHAGDEYATLYTRTPPA
ncbi:hypothetical protein E2562_022042 [Oryza meyeriana var. granulata]|uniref:Uncharacterized protein n=1 Tax=Oryza meyeriana var. granulata TaxID=110450 RepID=A0A6G1ENL1_9ORYZ|nr:hypothetical protein E2562_022042 [Oryza meyeriana var. granulata]